jgi:hypothetical protein
LWDELAGDSVQLTVPVSSGEGAFGSYLGLFHQRCNGVALKDSPISAATTVNEVLFGGGCLILRGHLRSS